MRKNLCQLNKQVYGWIRNSSSGVNSSGVNSSGVSSSKQKISLTSINSSCQFFTTIGQIEEKKNFHICCQKKCKKNRYKNNVFLYMSMSLIFVPLLINHKIQRGKTIHDNSVSCLSSKSFHLQSSTNTNSIDNLQNVDKEDKVEKVFLLKKDEIKNGQMIEVKVHNGKDSVLLAKVKDTIYCLGTKCPHYSAPLKSGLLTEKYITCPWHDAKFDLKTGECLNGPSFEDIPKYKVEINENDIYAYLPEEIKIGKEKKTCNCKDRCEKKTIVILGGGASTLGALETLIKFNFSGKIIICSEDKYKPYDRTTLSKNIGKFSKEEELYESIKLKEDIYYTKNKNIKYIHNVSVTKINTEKKNVLLNNGEIINYDKLIIATGLRPIQSPIKKVQSDNLFNIYSLRDNFRLSKLVKEGSRCVIIGSSFIGCELASALRNKKVHVTMVSHDTVPFVKIFGKKIGELILNSLKEKQVQFCEKAYPIEYMITKRLLSLGKNNSDKVVITNDTNNSSNNNSSNNSTNNSSYNSTNNLIHGVKLNNGEVIKCDYVIEAMGCIPNTQFLDSKFKNEKNFIITDNYFRVLNSDDMYAVGDVCVFPYFYTGETLNICHWNVAIQQGRIAAHNIMNDKKQEFRFLPFFNTNIMGNNFRVCGFASTYDKIIYEGDLLKKNFIGFFVKNEKIISIVTLGNSKMPALNECLTLNKVPKPYELEAGLKNSDSMIESIKM